MNYWNKEKRVLPSSVRGIFFSIHRDVEKSAFDRVVTHLYSFPDIGDSRQKIGQALSLSISKNLHTQQVYVSLHTYLNGYRDSGTD